MKRIFPESEEQEINNKPPKTEIEIPFETDNNTEEAEEAAYRERRQKRNERLKKRKRRQRIQKVAICLCIAAIAGGIFAYTKLGVTLELDASHIIAMFNDRVVKSGESDKEEVAQAETKNVVNEEADAVEEEDTKEEDTKEKKDTKEEKDAKEEITPTPTEKPESTKEDKIIMEQASFEASQYNYGKALAILRKADNYESNEEMQKLYKEIEETKANCVPWNPEDVTHVFYHSLIVDPSKAFDGDYKAAGYNQVMTTVEEFNKITQSMYEKGYVMVSLYDLAEVQEDGTIKKKRVFLPPGKIPFVLSQDDVSYYHCYTGDGIASKLIVDEDGKVRNEYVNDDGSVSVGDYDMIPLIDRFVEEHPDFSYKGSKGVIALTGYNGILGYRTDNSYVTRPDDLDNDKVEWLNAHPEFDIEAERAGAKKVADAMKANGWYFASHTWGHKNVGTASMERIVKDTELFKENVEPIIGNTDIIIFAFGADMAGSEEYSGEKFEYFKAQGYNYFCNVDSSKYYVQITDRYFRQGRRNLDGYRMYYNPEMVEDLFDATEVFDKSRPTPVQPMGEN